jgi:hypothetical protein
MRRIPARTSSWSSTRRTLIKGIISRMRDNATDTYLPHITGFYCYFKRQKMPSPRFGSHLWQCLCTLSGKSLRTVSCESYFLTIPIQKAQKTTDYVAHKYEAKYVTIINVLNR